MAGFWLRQTGTLGLVCWAAWQVAPACAQTARQWTAAREQMVKNDIVASGIENRGVIAVMRGTPRHEFVPVDQRRLAYFDMALPIGEHQTISPPFIVASMTEKLNPQPEDKILEIGTGSGYQAAVLAGLVREVYTIEIVEALGKRAAETLTRLGYKNVHPKIGDGFQGWAEHAPFDKIIVTCSPENVPKPLVEQLREGGRIVVPLGERYQQTLYLFRKVDGQLISQPLEPTFFVPMTGRAEQLRNVRPNSSIAAIVNGSFEDSTRFAGAPDGWYYVRQASLERQDLKGHGERLLHFHNAEPGRSSQVLQAIGVDGREVSELEVSAWIRAAGLKAGQSADQQARLSINFFNEDRAALSVEGLGPWQGSFGWTHESGRLPVPPEARLAVIAIGLLGGVGDISFDDVDIRAGK